MIDPRAFALAVLAVGLSAAASYAGPAVSSQPSRITEVFGDWTMVCVAPQDKAGRRSRCEAAEVIRQRGAKRALAKLAIGLSDGGYTIAALLPVNISFPSSVSLVDAGNAHQIQLAWQRCLPGACLAEAQVKAGTFENWRNETKPMHLSFVTASRRAETLPVSLRGMTQAIAALHKTAK
jgi:invasion protein IalB